MVYADFSSRELVKALRSKRYVPVGRAGSPVKPRYEHPKTSEVRVVTVPLVDADRISQDTYRSIAEQCGADDFKKGDRLDRTEPLRRRGPHERRNSSTTEARGEVCRPANTGARRPDTTSWTPRT